MSVTVVIDTSQPIEGCRPLGPRCLYSHDEVTPLSRIVDLVRATFVDPEIIVMAGFESKRVFMNKPKGVRIVENQLFGSTREVENIRLARMNSTNNNMIFMPDNLLCSEHDLISLSLGSGALISETLISELIVLSYEGRINNFSFYKKGFPEKYFTGIFSLQGRELTRVFNFAFNHINGPHFAFEALTEIAKVDRYTFREIISDKVEMIV